MVGRVGLEHRPDTAVRGEDLADVVDHRLGREAVGQDGTRAGGQETGPEVVDALLRLRERSLGHARRRAAGRVAQVVEEHDRVRREADVAGDVVLAVVDVRVQSTELGLGRPEGVNLITPPVVQDTLRASDYITETDFRL